MTDEKKTQPERPTQSREDDGGESKLTFRRKPGNEIPDPKYKPPKAQKSMDTDAKDSKD